MKDIDSRATAGTPPAASATEAPAERPLNADD